MCTTPGPVLGPAGPAAGAAVGGGAAPGPDGVWRAAAGVGGAAELLRPPQLQGPGRPLRRGETLVVLSVVLSAVLSAVRGAVPSAVLSAVLSAVRGAALSGCPGVSGGGVPQELPEQPHLHPPLTVFVSEQRAFGRVALVGSHQVASLMAFSPPGLGDMTEEEEEEPPPGTLQSGAG